MSKLSNTNHPIYKERGKMNMQILRVLIAFVILVMAATIAKLSSGQTIGAPQSSAQIDALVQQAQQNEEASQ